MLNIDDWADIYIRNGSIGGKQIVPVDSPEGIDPISLATGQVQIRTQAFEFHRANWSDWLTIRDLKKADLVKLMAKTWYIHESSDCNVNNKVYIEQMVRMQVELIKSKASKKTYRRPNSKRNLS